MPVRPSTLLPLNVVLGVCRDIQQRATADAVTKDEQVAKQCVEQVVFDVPLSLTERLEVFHRSVRTFEAQFPIIALVSRRLQLSTAKPPPTSAATQFYASAARFLASADGLGGCLALPVGKWPAPDGFEYCNARLSSVDLELVDELILLGDTVSAAIKRDMARRAGMSIPLVGTETAYRCLQTQSLGHLPSAVVGRWAHSIFHEQGSASLPILYTDDSKVATLNYVGREEFLARLLDLYEQCEAWNYGILKQLLTHFPPCDRLLRDSLPPAYVDSNSATLFHVMVDAVDPGIGADAVASDIMRMQAAIDGDCQPIAAERLGILIHLLSALHLCISADPVRCGAVEASYFIAVLCHCRLLPGQINAAVYDALFRLVNALAIEAVPTGQQPSSTSSVFTGTAPRLQLEPEQLRSVIRAIPHTTDAVGVDAATGVAATGCQIRVDYARAITLSLQLLSRTWRGEHRDLQCQTLLESMIEHGQAHSSTTDHPLWQISTRLLTHAMVYPSDVVRILTSSQTVPSKLIHGTLLSCCCPSGFRPIHSLSAADIIAMHSSAALRTRAAGTDDGPPHDPQPNGQARRSDGGSQPSGGNDPQASAPPTRGDPASLVLSSASPPLHASRLRRVSQEVIRRQHAVYMQRLAQQRKAFEVEEASRRQQIAERRERLRSRTPAARMENLHEFNRRSADEVRRSQSRLPIGHASKSPQQQALANASLSGSGQSDPNVRLSTAPHRILSGPHARTRHGILRSDSTSPSHEADKTQETQPAGYHGGRGPADQATFLDLLVAAETDSTDPLLGPLGSIPPDEHAEMQMPAADQRGGSASNKTALAARSEIHTLELPTGTLADASTDPALMRQILANASRVGTRKTSRKPSNADREHTRRDSSNVTPLGSNRGDAHDERLPPEGNDGTAANTMSPGSRGMPPSRRRIRGEMQAQRSELPSQRRPREEEMEEVVIGGYDADGSTRALVATETPDAAELRVMLESISPQTPGNHQRPVALWRQGSGSLDQTVGNVGTGAPSQQHTAAAGNAAGLPGSDGMASSEASASLQDLETASTAVNSDAIEQPASVGQAYVSKPAMWTGPTGRDTRSIPDTAAAPDQIDEDDEPPWFPIDFTETPSEAIEQVASLLSGSGSWNQYLATLLRGHFPADGVFTHELDQYIEQEELAVMGPAVYPVRCLTRGERPVIQVDIAARSKYRSHGAYAAAIPPSSAGLTQQLHDWELRELLKGAALQVAVSSNPEKQRTLQGRIRGLMARLVDEGAQKQDSPKHSTAYSGQRRRSLAALVPHANQLRRKSVTAEHSSVKVAPSLQPPETVWSIALDTNVVSEYTDDEHSNDSATDVMSYGAHTSAEVPTTPAPSGDPGPSQPQESPWTQIFAERETAMQLGLPDTASGAVHASGILSSRPDSSEEVQRSPVLRAASILSQRLESSWSGHKAKPTFENVSDPAIDDSELTAMTARLGGSADGSKEVPAATAISKVVATLQASRLRREQLLLQVLLTSHSAIVPILRFNTVCLDSMSFVSASVAWKYYRLQAPPQAVLSSVEPRLTISVRYPVATNAMMRTASVMNLRENKLVAGVSSLWSGNVEMFVAVRRLPTRVDHDWACTRPKASRLDTGGEAAPQWQRVNTIVIVPSDPKYIRRASMSETETRDAAHSHEYYIGLRSENKGHTQNLLEYGIVANAFLDSPASETLPPSDTVTTQAEVIPGDGRSQPSFVGVMDTYSAKFNKMLREYVEERLRASVRHVSTGRETVTSSKQQIDSLMARIDRALSEDSDNAVEIGRLQQDAIVLPQVGGSGNAECRNGLDHTNASDESMRDPAVATVDDNTHCCDSNATTGDDATDTALPLSSVYDVSAAHIMSAPSPQEALQRYFAEVLIQHISDIKAMLGGEAHTSSPTDPNTVVHPLSRSHPDGMSRQALRYLRAVGKVNVPPPVTYKSLRALRRLPRHNHQPDNEHHVDFVTLHDAGAGVQDATHKRTLPPITPYTAWGSPTRGNTASTEKKRAALNPTLLVRGKPVLTPWPAVGT